MKYRKIHSFMRCHWELWFSISDSYAIINVSSEARGFIISSRFTLWAREADPAVQTPAASVPAVALSAVLTFTAERTVGSEPGHTAVWHNTAQHTLHTDLITSVQCCYWTHRCHTWRPSLLKHRYTCRSPGHTGCPPHSHMTESRSDRTCPAHILRKTKRGLGGGGGVCVSMCMMIVWPLSQREPCDPAGQRHCPVRGWHEAPFTQSQRCWQPEPNRPAGHAETHTHTQSAHCNCVNELLVDLTVFTEMTVISRLTAAASCHPVTCAVIQTQTLQSTVRTEATLGTLWQHTHTKSDKYLDFIICVI